MIRPVSKQLVLGTRGSELAKVQTRLASEALKLEKRTLRIEVKVVTTAGDRSQERIDAAAGRKGLFTADLEKVLLAGEIDVAVHSAKDLPSELAPGTEIAAVLQRGAVEDVLVSARAGGLKGLPHDAVVGTGSVRRQHQLRWKRPDLELLDVRGNVPTRLRKLATGDWHAVVLARAGLERLALQPEKSPIMFDGSQFFTDVLPVETFLPAGGQGVVALQIRRDDAATREIVELASHAHTMLCLQAERTFLRLLNADCQSPVGVLATIKAGTMNVRAQVFDEGATVPRTAEVEGDMHDREQLAMSLFEKINGQ